MNPVKGRCEAMHLLWRAHPSIGKPHSGVLFAGSGPNLLGRNWLNHIQLDWRQINQVQQSSLYAILQQHEAVFQGGLGGLKG